MRNVTFTTQRTLGEWRRASVDEPGTLYVDELRALEAMTHPDGRAWTATFKKTSDPLKVKSVDELISEAARRGVKGRIVKLTLAFAKRPTAGYVGMDWSRYSEGELILDAERDSSYHRYRHAAGEPEWDKPDPLPAMGDLAATCAGKFRVHLVTRAEAKEARWKLLKTVGPAVGGLGAFGAAVIRYGLG